MSIVYRRSMIQQVRKARAGQHAANHSNAN